MQIRQIAALLQFLAPSFISAQVVASKQFTTFNSSFALSQDQINSAYLTDADAASINNIVNYERSQYAGGPTTEDAFYVLPEKLPSPLYPGALLKVEDYTNITNYALPPNTALSRILYVSRNLNGTLIPVSGFILWPFHPRSFLGIPTTAAPAVLWSHMTSGWFGPAAPSKHRALWAGDSAPFALALAGYAVVASDFAGLGIDKGFHGEILKHQYLAMPASASDSIYALHAAQAAFPDRLSKSFVSVGQSQGGGVSWGVAELLAKNSSLATGFLGSISVSGTVNAFNASTTYIGPFVGQGLDSIFPDFKIETWLTPFGIGRFNLFKDIKAGLATALGLFTTTQAIAKPGLTDTWEAKAFAKLSNVGSKPLAGPLMVIQGTADVFVPYSGVSHAIGETCKAYPQNQISFLAVNGSGHVPTLDASRTVWMKWIEDRFEGKVLEKVACGKTDMLESFLPVDRYQKTWNSFAMWVGADEYSYQQPLAL